MKKTFFFLIFSFFLFADTYGQKPLPKDANLKQAQDWLKKNLVGKVGSIRKVEFDGCKISIKQSQPNYSASSGSGSFVGGGFPRDDSSSYFSAGPDRINWDNGWKRKMIFDFTDLDIENIKIQKTALKNKTAIILQTVGEQNKIFLLENKKTTNKSIFGVVVKTKSAEKFADAFRHTIRRCKE